MAHVWVQITLILGVFLMGQIPLYSQMPEDVPYPAMQNIVVTIRDANVRDTPNISSTILSTVNQAIAFDLLSQQLIDDVMWYEVRLDAERNGWISSQVANLVVQWQRIIEDLDDIEMALVPAGCFVMGSESGEDDELPLHLQCFDTPFWIDIYEVTNAQYGDTGYYEGDTRPHENITWFDAQAYCETRDARLPTEREWAYAARSPMSYLFPWGNTYIDENVVSSWIETKRRTESVGSRPEGISWVGAYDMSGNVWEWTASLYDEYPYVADDGREVLDADGLRVVRGGACCSYIIADVRATYRFPIDPYLQDPNVGFRCVKDIEWDETTIDGGN